MSSVDSLGDRVRAAFPETRIVAADAFRDWGGTYPDAVEYKKQIDGKTWGEADAKYLVRRSDALGFLGTRSLISVLPVYLEAAIKDPLWSPATGMLVLILQKPEKQHKGLGTERFQSLVDELTLEQRAAIAEALEYIATAYAEDSLGIAARAALDSYWFEHLGGRSQ